MHDGGGGGGGARRAVVRPLGIHGAVRSCKRVVFDLKNAYEFVMATLHGRPYGYVMNI